MTHAHGLVADVLKEVRKIPVDNVRKKLEHMYVGFPQYTVYRFPVEKVGDNTVKMVLLKRDHRYLALYYTFTLFDPKWPNGHRTYYLNGEEIGKFDATAYVDDDDDEHIIEFASRVMEAILNPEM